MTHWCRVVMNQTTKDWVEDYLKNHLFSKLSCLEISGSQWSEYLLSKGHKYKSVFYPHFDITDISLFEDKYDVIVAEQVWEHVHLPYTAIKNAYRMLNPGGMLLITTPFLIQVHNFPGDYTRWTKEGLKYLFVEGGFQLNKIKTDSWGNKDCIMDGFYSPWSVFNSQIHSLINQPDFPIVVWGMAIK